MTNKTKLSLALEIVFVVLLIVLLFRDFTKPSTSVVDLTAGAVGGQLIEDNIPYYRNNGGEYTLLPKTIGGAVSLSGALSLTSTFALGSSGTAQNKQIVGSCTGTQPAGAFNASTTQEMICAVTGVTSGDTVVATLSTPALYGPSGGIEFGFRLINARATTTGFVGFLIENGTGAATSSIASVYRKINYFIGN